MSKISRKKRILKSPNRNTFQKERYLERRAKEGRTAENDEEVRAMVEYYDEWDIRENEQEKDPEWQKNNLEYDLRSTKWICDKAKQDEHYAQNLYAALCNNQFQKLDVVPILTEQRWHCSWRHAGGVIADMREEGDYIDWYCSGIRDDYEDSNDGRKYVSEAVVTDEIREDLKQLGWIVIPEDDQKY